ncbi:MAG: hypothetical protein WCR19_05795, partial [Acholeplasmataceae bacterium]
MIKKVLSFIIVFVLSISLMSCEKADELYTYSYYDYMDTFITINFMTSDDTIALEYKADIEDIFKTYHDLTSNYNVLPVSSTYLENIFSINQK